MGSLIVLPMARRWSRKTTCIGWTWIWLIGFILTLAVPEYRALVVGRAMKGLALGALSGIIPGYIQDSFTQHASTLILSLYQAVLPAGIFLMSMVAYLACLSDFATWPVRSCWTLMLVPTAPAAILVFFLRNCPCDYILRKHYDPALIILKDVHGNDMELLKSEFQKLYLKCYQQKRLSYSMCWVPKFRKRVVLAVFCQASVQLSGINVISMC